MLNDGFRSSINDGIVSPSHGEERNPTDEAAVEQSTEHVRFAHDSLEGKATV
jgi:hypothetical protein